MCYAQLARATTGIRSRPNTGLVLFHVKRLGMITLWSRVQSTSNTWGVGQLLIAPMLPGWTLARVHFGFRIDAVTNSEQNVLQLFEDYMAFGVVTLSTANGSTAPNAFTFPGDSNPPLERWIWWGTTRMKVASSGQDHPDISIWHSDDTGLVVDTKAQVKANVPAGQNLQVFLTWAPTALANWSARGVVNIQCWASALIEIP